jgi:lipopolysaccharide export system permease protein
MRILTRYVLFDLIKVFVLTLTGLTVVIFVGLLGRAAVEKGLGLGPLLRMTPYLLPEAMQFTVPGTMLLATTTIYGRMSSYNEIVAVKSLGISPMTLIWPTIFLATFMSLIGVAVNNLAVSWGHSGQQRVILESLEEIAYGQLRMHRNYSDDKISVIVRGVDGRKLIQPTLTVLTSDGRVPTIVTAEEAELWSNLEENKLVFRGRNVVVTGSVNYTDPGTFEHAISIDNSNSQLSPSHYALADIGPAAAEQKRTINAIHESMTAQAAFAMLTGNFDALSEESWNARQRELSNAEQRLQRFHTEPWRRWANGFSCLGFVLIGVPMAIRLRYAELLASFFACFLPILIVYYPLFIVSVDQAKNGSVPPQSVWLGNLVLALWGVWLLRRVIRY